MMETMGILMMIRSNNDDDDEKTKEARAMMNS